MNGINATINDSQISIVFNFMNDNSVRNFATKYECYKRKYLLFNRDLATQ